MSLTADTRDHRSRPTSGSMYRAVVTNYDDRSTGAFSFRTYEAEALHRWHGTCFRGPAQEATMTSIKATVQEWGYPAAVLISWLMATAYTISKII